jgi:hypothetical protein
MGQQERGHWRGTEGEKVQKARFVRVFTRWAGKEPGDCRAVFRLRGDQPATPPDRTRCRDGVRLLRALHPLQRPCEPPKELGRARVARSEGAHPFRGAQLTQDAKQLC